MACAEKLGKSNEEFIEEWYKKKKENLSSNVNIKKSATFYAAKHGHI